MNCPVCAATLVTENMGDMVIEFCRQGCKGLWLDWAELKKLEHGDPALNTVFSEAFESPRTSDENRGKLSCPRCSLPMHWHFFANARAVSVDECYECGGFFLDSGELKAIQEGEAQSHSVYAQQLNNTIPSGFKAAMTPSKMNLRQNAVRSFTQQLFGF